MTLTRVLALLALISLFVPTVLLAETAAPSLPALTGEDLAVEASAPGTGAMPPAAEAHHPQDVRAGWTAPRPAARPLHMLRFPVPVETRAPAVRPVARTLFLPNTRWDFRLDSRLWVRAAMAAIDGHGAPLLTVVPRDIDAWCPAYRTAGPAQRQAFWVGMMSALSKHESTYNPNAVGGGGLWYGLLQIYPDTARRYGCRARTGEALKDPVENLSCAARIMAVTVPRDGAVALREGRWRGVAADWGPMTKPGKIAEMSGWTRRQTYCTAPNSVRPRLRTAAVEAVALDRAAALSDG